MNVGLMSVGLMSVGLMSVGLMKQHFILDVHQFIGHGLIPIVLCKYVFSINKFICINKDDNIHKSEALKRYNR